MTKGNTMLLNTCKLCGNETASPEVVLVEGCEVVACPRCAKAAQSKQNENLIRG